MTRPSGLLRALVLFHEPELLGAGKSVLNAAESLGEYGWSVSGWIPGEGQLADVAAERLAATACAPRPIAVSGRGWREAPGTLARLRMTPRYLAALREALLELRPHVVHANTLRCLPEACVARSLGLPVVFHVHELPPVTLKRSATVRLAALTGDVFVGVSHAVSTMVRQYARGTPVITAHNGIEDLIGMSVKSGDGFTVGTVGTICRVKGTDIFLRAASLAAERRADLLFEHAGEPALPRDEDLDNELAHLLGSPELRDGPSSSVAVRRPRFCRAGTSSSFRRVRMRSRSRRSRRWLRGCP